MRNNIIDIQRELSNWLSNAKKIAIVGVGNRSRKDDFIGIKVARELKKVISSRRVVILDCGTIPENYIDIIEKFEPSHILVIDAAQIGLEPGDLMLVDSKKIYGLTLSTHNLPLNIFADYLKKVAGAKIALLAIQPDKIEYEIGLTKKLRYTANELTEVLLKVLSRK